MRLRRSTWGAAKTLVDSRPAARRVPGWPAPPSAVPAPGRTPAPGSYHLGVHKLSPAAAKVTLNACWAAPPAEAGGLDESFRLPAGPTHRRFVLDVGQTGTLRVRLLFSASSPGAQFLVHMRRSNWGSALVIVDSRRERACRIAARHHHLRRGTGAHGGRQVLHRRAQALAGACDRDAVGELALAGPSQGCHKSRTRTYRGQAPVMVPSMRALVKTRAEPGLWLEDVPEPEHGINDVLIRVRRTGICGTDVHIEHWDPWAQRTIPVPLVIGHEFVGEVVEVGSNVTDFHPGDLVSGEGHVVCGRCRNCMAGRRHLCAHTQGVGVTRPGAFAELIALPMTNIWHHWPGIDEDVAAIFDPFGNAVHTALAFPVLGEDVLITGAGPIGCMAAAVVRHAGARHVVVSDPNRYRRALAERMGASVTVDPTARELADVQAELGMTEGFDVGLEMSGNPAALRAHAREHVTRRPHRHARHPHRGDRDRLDAGRVQHADPAGHLWP